MGKMKEGGGGLVVCIATEFIPPFVFFLVPD